MTHENPEILLVHSREEEAATIYALLRKHFPNCPIYLAGNSMRGLEFIFGTGTYSHRRGKGLPILAIIDKDLLDRDGFSLIREIGQVPETKGLPIILLHSSPDSIKLEKNLGQADVVKPLTLQKFGKALEELGLEDVFRPLIARIRQTSG